ncbi:MAG: hypothetical protein VST66_11395, partial [Nitrospirota bacterium]|nr:hypothetical protein [Nitrospirota bacterium]
MAMVSWLLTVHCLGGRHLTLLDDLDQQAAGKSLRGGCLKGARRKERHPPPSRGHRPRMLGPS